MTSMKSDKSFSCELCHYNTANKYDYKKHILTDKHRLLTNAAALLTKTANQRYFTCNCGQEYKHRQSLYNHKKKCKYNDDIIKSDEIQIDYKALFIKMMKENQEMQHMFLTEHKETKAENKKLRNQISELIPKIGNNNNNINQKFNINVFLNEQCKDALTMEQFINKIEVSLSNLMLTKNKGINEGISNIFIENMNKLSLYERPIHCTDAKRETMYIKSEGLNGESPKWEKDDNNVKIKSAIKRVTHLQHKNINTWIDKHPDWENKSDLQDEYLQIVKKCTDDINETKVIKRICDATPIT
jgi:hypothetical protein